MMEALLPSFHLVQPVPPYPPVWETLTDPWDHPIWAAAQVGGASYVLSENARDYPPKDGEGKHVFENIEYLPARDFLGRLAAGSV